MTTRVANREKSIDAASGPQEEAKAYLRSRTFQERALGTGFAAVLRFLSWTWRVEIAGQDFLDTFAEPPSRHIVAFWHRNYITLFWLFRNRSTIVVTNQSHRGQIIAGICQSAHMPNLQLPATGNKRMLESIERATSDGSGLAIAVDGPLGPPREVKSGVLHLASRLACPIIPVSVATGWKHVFRSRWDKLEIPYPFSRVFIVAGTPIHISNPESRDERRLLISKLRDSIEAGATVARQNLYSF